MLHLQNIGNQHWKLFTVDSTLTKSSGHTCEGYQVKIKHRDHPLCCFLCMRQVSGVASSKHSNIDFTGVTVCGYVWIDVLILSIIYTDISIKYSL